jgi:hypothetical protein
MDKTENRNKPTAVRARHFTSAFLLSYVSSNCIFNVNQRQLCGRDDFQNRFIPTDHYWVCMVSVYLWKQNS